MKYFNTRESAAQHRLRRPCGTGAPSRRRLHLLRASVLSVVLFATASSAMVPTASAAEPGNANSYLVVNNWRCVGGGRVTGVFGAVDRTSAYGDWGDNIIYPRVVKGVTNQFNGRAYCDRPWYRGGGYWINVILWNFKPTASGQTFWF